MVTPQSRSRVMARPRSSRSSSWPRVKLITLGRQCSLPSLIQSSSGLVHLAHVEEEVLGRAHLQVGAAGDLGARVLQFERVVEAAAVVALVAARVGIAAEGAGALDIAVGQEALGQRVEPLLLRVLVDEAGLPVAQEHLLRHIPVVLRVGVGVEVEGEPHLEAAVDKEAVVLLDHLGVG